MTNEEILSRGMSASALLSDETFSDVMNTLSNYHLSAMLACEPQDRVQMETRDYHFNMIKSLQEVSNTLVEWVQVGKELEKALNETEDYE